MPSSNPINWAAYPALLFSVCIGAGILATSAMQFITLAGCLAAAGISFVLIGINWHSSTIIGLFLLGISTGGVRHHIRDVRPDHHLLALAQDSAFALENHSTSLRGQIISFPAVNNRYIRFTLDVDSIQYRSFQIPTTGKLQVTLWKSFDSDGTAYPTFAYHQDVQVDAGIREVAPPGNPAEFDYKAYLARRGIHFTLSVSNPAQIIVLKEETTPPAQLLTGIRAYVKDSIMTNVPTPRAQAILLALLLGDRSRLKPGIKQQFQHTGLMHLLAISGLHVMMIGLVFYNLLLPLLKRMRLSWTAMEWTRSTVTLSILLTYCLITGAPPSVVRALVMTALVLGGVLAQRIYQPLNALGAAAIVLLLVNPVQLFDAGFQLSFAAVGGILTITPVLNRISHTGLDHNRAAYYLKNTLFASTAATLATIPVTLFHFGQVAFGGLLLNLVAIPITAVILSGAVITVLFHGGIPIVSAAVGFTTDRAIRALLYVASSGDQVLRWTLLEETVRSPLIIGGLVSGLLLFIHWQRPRLRWRFANMCLLALTVHLWIQTVRDFNDHSLGVLFFDVGQGDAALVELPNDRYFLVDGGNRSSYIDEGARTLLPHLRQYGIDKLEAVVISHAHSDHMGGLLTIVQEIPVNRVIYNGQRYSSGLFNDMRTLTDSLQITFQAVTAGDTLAFHPAVRIQVLAPLRQPLSETDPNEASVVVRLVYREISFLFTGDIERRTEQLLLNTFAPLLPADVVKVPHHGSKTSSIAGFVHQTTAVQEDTKMAIVSVGRDNKFGHPAEHIIKRWQLAGAQTRLTTEGAVWLQTNGRELFSVSWK